MKPSICLTFKIHQPTNLRLYRFFEIGKDSHYYDDFANRSMIKKTAADCYLPMNQLILDLIKSTKGKLKVAFAISGGTLDLFDRYCPEVLDSFRDLNATGCVEFLCEPYYHSFAAVADDAEFAHQVNKHRNAIKEYIGADVKTFVNTDMVYTDAIGEKIADLGFKTVITEGAKHVLGWKSPNYVYSCVYNPKLKLLLRNPGLSDDISIRFSDRSWAAWPLSAESYYSWLEQARGEQVVNLCMNYKAFGEFHKKESGIFEFFTALVNMVVSKDCFIFATPSEVAKKYAAVDSIDVQDPVSCENEEKDMSKWLGNDLQKEAFNKLYALQEKLAIADLPQLWEDYGLLQESDHFFNMNSRFFTDNGNHRYVNPYDTPFEAFINYMNVLADFAIRVDEELN